MPFITFRKSPSIPSLVRVFILNFDKCFFYIYGDDHMLLYGFYFINVVNYIKFIFEREINLAFLESTPLGHDLLSFSYIS